MNDVAVSRTRGIVALVLGLAMLEQAEVSLAQPMRGCGAGQSPNFRFGFASLKSLLGDQMGVAVSCEYADPSGDTLQDTSTGLAFWRK